MKFIKSILLLALFVSAFISCKNGASKQNTSSQTVVTTTDTTKTVVVSDTAKEAVLSLNAMFVDFTLGDAEHYTFKDKAGKTWDFGGCEDEKIQFAKELPEAQANENNRGYGANKTLQNKWFDLKYVIRNQPEYQDGPMAKVPVIVSSTMQK